MLIVAKKGLRHKLSYFHKKQIRSTTMASNVRQKAEHWRPIVACGGSKTKSQVTSVSLPLLSIISLFISYLNL